MTGYVMQPDGLGAEYGLTVPFVVCSSSGGPYDDAAFMAGWQAAALDAHLAMGEAQYQFALYTPLSPQVELIAMHRGYKAHGRVWAQDPTWTVFLFEKTAGEVEDLLVRGEE